MGGSSLLPRRTDRRTGTRRRGSARGQQNRSFIDWIYRIDGKGRKSTMSRSGYSDDYENVGLWRQAVKRAASGYRGQHLLRKLRAALDAMPVKRLITGAIRDEQGEVCALGALDPTAPDYYAEELAAHFKIATALASEIVYMNDEWNAWRTASETPEERWTRMRAWVESQITPEEPLTIQPLPVTPEGTP